MVRALTLVEQPLPAQVIQAIAEQLGGDPQQLAALGLLEPGLAPVHSLNDPARPSRRVNPLAAGRLASLTEAERQTVAALTLAPLHGAWTADGSWPDDVDLALCRLAVLVAGPAAEPISQPIRRLCQSKHAPSPRPSPSSRAPMPSGRWSATATRMPPSWRGN
jgi:hypothetical protein